jgi:hypothetical protein
MGTFYISAAPLDMEINSATPSSLVLPTGADAPEAHVRCKGVQSSLGSLAGIGSAPETVDICLGPGMTGVPQVPVGRTRFNVEATAAASAAAGVEDSMGGGDSAICSASAARPGDGGSALNGPRTGGECGSSHEVYMAVHQRLAARLVVLEDPRADRCVVRGMCALARQGCQCVQYVCAKAGGDSHGEEM